MEKCNSTPVLIDWLSLSGLTKEYKLEKCKIKKLEYGTSVFARVEELFLSGERIATITSLPYSPVIKEDLIIIKLDNWVLYSTEFIVIYGIILKELNIREEKISRIDICKDLVTFYKKRKPSNLIKYFLSGNLLKVGKSKYCTIGDTDRTLTYDYLSFGRKASNLNVYLYNKSRELQEVQNKQHIQNKWTENNFEKDLPVYRLEFSLKKSNITLINKTSGENLKFDITRIFIQEDLEILYETLIMKYFHFRKNTGQKNASREESIRLFNEEYHDSIIWEIEKGLETNRSDKIFLKKLDNMYSELRSDDLQLFKAIEKLREEFSNRKNLSEYLEEKLKPATLLLLEEPDYFKPELKKKALLKKTNYFGTRIMEEVEEVLSLEILPFYSDDLLE